MRIHPGVIFFLAASLIACKSQVTTLPQTSSHISVLRERDKLTESLRDSEVSYSQAIYAIELLRETPVPIAFWRRIVSNPRYIISVRRRCAFEIIRRFCKPGDNFIKIVHELRQNPPLVNPGSLSEVGSQFGPMPVNAAGGRSAFCIAFGQKSGQAPLVWVVLSRRLSADQIYRALSTRSAEITDCRIVDIGYSDEYSVKEPG